MKKCTAKGGLYLKAIFILCGFCMLYNSALAQFIQGRIINNQGEPVPFATVYAKEIYKGTTSNIEGYYKLELPRGKHIIAFQYLGYETREVEIDLQDSVQVLDVTLDERMYMIPEVRVLASGEDPAYSIMRRAIGMSQYYLKQVGQYECQVYLKGTGVIKKIPGLLKRQFKKAGFKEGETFVSENLTNIYYELPNTMEREVISMRNSGPQDAANPMDFITLSLYQDLGGIYSPLDKEAFSHYRFKLKGSFYDNKRLIHKIEVIPKHKGYEYLKGHIFIVDGIWHLHSVDLELEQKLFSIEIRQVYAPVEYDVWMPVSHDFFVEAGAMGMEVEYSYVASVNKYDIQLNKQLDHSVFLELKRKAGLLREEEAAVLEELKAEHARESGEEVSAISELVQKENMSNRDARKLNRLIEKEARKKEKASLEIIQNFTIADSARKMDEVYWDTIRPVPLTSNELDSYNEDSIQLAIDSSKIDSRSYSSAFKFRQLFFGKVYRYNENTTRFYFSGLTNLTAMGYNLVAGPYTGVDMYLDHELDKGRELHVGQEVRYGFARNKPTAKWDFQYAYAPLKRGNFTLSLGRELADYNSTSTMVPFVNMVSTLFESKNYLRLYEQDFVKISNKIDLTNGLELRLGLAYNSRQPEENHTTFTLFQPFGDRVQSNIPYPALLGSSLLASSKSLSAEVEFQYTPRYYYGIREGRKIMVYSHYPTFKLNYQHGVPGLLGSDVSYSKLKAGVEQGLDAGNLGRLFYTIEAGGFIKKDELYFADYKHFSSLPSWYTAGGNAMTFRGLDYYPSATAGNYAQFHLNLRRNKLLLNYLPVLNKSLAYENVYFKSLYREGFKPWHEMGYGMNQVFWLANLEVFTAFKGHKFEGIFFKLAIPIFSGSGEVQIGN